AALDGRGTATAALTACAARTVAATNQYSPKGYAVATRAAYWPSSCLVRTSPRARVNSPPLRTPFRHKRVSRRQVLPAQYQQGIMEYTAQSFQEQPYRAQGRNAGALWFGILAGPIAWIISLNLAYNLVQVACDQQSFLTMHLV